MFRGQLYGGKLFFGQLFGAEEEETPQPELVLEYHGSGGHEERDLVQRVLDKWATIERSRAKKAEALDQKRAKRRVEVVLKPSASDLNLRTDLSEKDHQVSDKTQPIGSTSVEKTTPIGIPSRPAIPPVIQTMFEPRVLDRVAPTRSTPDTVIAVPEDDMDEVMTVLLALEEAGEL